MKNMFKYLAVMAISVSLVGLVACEPEPTTPEDAYSFQYMGSTLEPNQTVTYSPSMIDIAPDWATTTDFFVVNNTDADLQSVLKVEKVSGSAEADVVMFCFGEECRSATCPWTSEPLTIVPGVNENLPLHVQYAPSSINVETVYRITIGKGTAMESPRSVLLKLGGLTE